MLVLAAVSEGWIAALSEMPEQKLPAGIKLKRAKQSGSIEQGRVSAVQYVPACALRTAGSVVVTSLLKLEASKPF
jgi:hypothetical protein